MKLVLCREHAKVVPDEQSLLHNFLSLARLQNLDRDLVAELGLDLVVDRIEIDTVMAFLNAADVLYTSQIVYFLSVDADDASLVNLHEHLFFVKYDTLNLASANKD